MTEEDALHFLVRYLKDPPERGPTSYGYDVYIPNVIFTYLRHTNDGLAQEAGRDHRHPIKKELSPHFYAAAWELCLRGILRPGVRAHGEQVVDDGSAGNGYSVTPFGRTWLAESNEEDYIPVDPGRFGQMLSPYQTRFGAGFTQRAMEANRCYKAQAYLACCAMCGAAAESILLAAAIGSTGDEQAVLREYGSRGGRGRVQARLLGQASEDLRRQFERHSGLITYWRDEAAHGKSSAIDNNEGHSALLGLVHFARFVDEHWAELTSSAP